MATALAPPLNDPSPSYATFRSTKRFGALDGLRALSVLAVIWQHTGGIVEREGAGILARGHHGVNCFFAISGFLITTLLLREKEDTGRVSLRGFYLRRSLRIFPIYYVVLAVYVAAMAALRPDTPEAQEFLRNLPAFATYTSNWFIDQGDSVTFYFAWSLATEEQFYLLWPPLLVLLFATRRWPLAPLLTVLGLVALDQIAGALGWTIVASMALPILLGVAAALLMHDRRGYRWVAAVFGHRWAAPLTAAVTLVVMHVDASPEPLVQTLLVCVVVACCVREDTPLHTVLRWRPLVLLGTISYGMYLMHMLAANAVRPVLDQRFGVSVFLATSLVVSAAAYASYRLFEAPLQRLGRRSRG